MTARTTAHDGNLENLDDEQAQLGLVLHQTDHAEGLGFVPVSLHVLRSWCTEMTPAPLALDHPLMVRSLLEHLAQRFPCPAKHKGTPGSHGLWEARTCNGVWCVHVPMATVENSPMGVIARLVEVRHVVLGEPRASEDRDHAGVRHVTVEQRPTGRLVFMDDTVLEATLKLAQHALNRHVVTTRERHALEAAVNVSVLLPQARARSRL